MSRPNGAALLRRRILDGLARTGTDPWAATEIAKALGVSALSVRQAAAVLAAEGAVRIVSRRPFALALVRP